MTDQAKKVPDPVLGICCSCQFAHPIHRRGDLPIEECENWDGPYGCGEAGFYTMDAHMIFGDSGPWCDGEGDTPQTILPGNESIVGKASCGCVYHAEDGIPCEHDRALVAKQ